MSDRREEAFHIAWEMVADAWRTRMNYFVMGARFREAPPFRWEWQRKNLFGVTFNIKKQDGEAAQWIANALLAGYSVFHSSNRYGGSGRSLHTNIWVDRVE